MTPKSLLYKTLKFLAVRLNRIVNTGSEKTYPMQEKYDSVYNYNKTVTLQKSVDIDELPIPWFTYSAIAYIDQLDLSDKTVFEWGSGHSSLYFSNKCKSIVSIEFKPEWYEYVKSLLKPNMTLHLAETRDYASIIGTLGESYDIIIIDGEIDRRMDCAKEAVKYLKTGGILILDNSDWLPNTTSYLREKGFQQIDFIGPGPINPYFWCTSFYLSHNTVLKPLNAQQPGHVPGGLNNIRD